MAIDESYFTLLDVLLSVYQYFSRIFYVLPSSQVFIHN